MDAPPIDSELRELRYEDEPRRRVRLRIEGPAGYGDGPPRPVVVVLHGFKGFMHWGFFPELSRRVAGAGMVCISMNASGCGVGGPDMEVMDDDEGFERDTFSRELEDLSLVRRFVANGAVPGVDAEREALLGHSRGGGIVVLAAAARAPRALVTWSSLDSLDRFDDATRERWRRDGHLEVPNARTGQVHRLGLAMLEDLERNRERLDVLAAAARVECPALVVHGTADPAVEFACAERLAGALPDAELVAIEGAGHTFGATHPFAGAGPELERAFEATLGHLAAHLDA